MKISKTKYLKFLPLVLGVILFALQACSTTGVSGRIDNQDNNGDSALAEVKQELGVKSSFQIFDSMSAIVGPQVTLRSNRVRDYFNQKRASLPDSNNITVFGASQINAIHNLAWEFCDRMMDDSVPRDEFFAGTEFSSSRSLNTSAKRESMASLMAERSCGPQVVETDDRIAMRESLHELIDTLQAQGQNDDNVIRGICTAAISSACVTQF